MLTHVCTCTPHADISMYPQTHMHMHVCTRMHTHTGKHMFTHTSPAWLGSEAHALPLPPCPAGSMHRGHAGESGRAGSSGLCSLRTELLRGSSPVHRSTAETWQPVACGDGEWELLYWGWKWVAATVSSVKWLLPNSQKCLLFTQLALDAGGTTLPLQTKPALPIPICRPVWPHSAWDGGGQAHMPAPFPELRPAWGLVTPTTPCRPRAHGSRWVQPWGFTVPRGLWNQPTPAPRAFQ